MKIIAKLLTFALLLQFYYPSALLAQTAFEAVLGQGKGIDDVLINEVTSVDTFKLADGRRFRLIGLKGPDIPEKIKVERELKGEMGFVMNRQENALDPTSTLEEEAFAFAREMLEGKHVRLEFDHLQKSDDHKTLVYVYLLDDDRFANAEILRQGFASLSIRPPNTKHEDLLREAYQEARQERRGLHGQ